MSLDLSVGVLKDTTHTDLANVLCPVSDLLKDIFFSQVWHEYMFNLYSHKKKSGLALFVSFYFNYLSYLFYHIFLGPAFQKCSG